jgi:beta-glucanase (GH16 family)
MTITPRKWKLNFKDDFDGDSLNTNIWTRFEYPHTNYYVRDGALTLLAERIFVDEDEIYTMSGIRTLQKYSLKGGCFMARMKSPDKGGCNSAFWLMPEGSYTRDFFFMDTKLKNYGCSEIDIVEYSPFYGKEFPLTMHFWNSSGAHTAKSYWGSCDDNIYEDYHEYACIWEQDGIYFYFDGKPVFANRDVDTHSRAVAAYIVLSVNSAKIHEGLEWLGPCTDDMFPFETKFDWVKTYK